MSDTKKVLITGGCGFIGTNLTQFILENTDWNVSILDDLSTGSKQHISKFDNSRIELIIGDIRKKSDVQKVIKNCSYVVNLAAQCGVPTSVKDPMFDMDVNVSGVLNLLNHSVENNIEKFIQASSAAVLGDQEMPIDEKKLPSPLSPYGASKLAGEAYCSAFSSIFNLNSVVLRFSNVYGPWSNSKTSVIASFIQRIMEEKGIIIYGDGNQTRDFIYSVDIAQGIYLSLISSFRSYQIFQLGTGIETSINELHKYFENTLNKSIEVNYLKRWPGDVERNYVDITKAKRIMNFMPKVDLKNGLKKTIDWYLKKK